MKAGREGGREGGSGRERGNMGGDSVELFAMTVL